MARRVYGNDYGDVANRELSMDAARDSRYFNSLSANRAAQALQQQQQQAQAGNDLSWQQLLQNAALRSQGRQDDLSQQNFSNRLSLASLARGDRDSARRESSVLEDLGLRRRELDLRYGPEQQSDRALGRFEKLAPSLADDPAITEESLGTMRPDLSPDDLAVAQAMFRSNRRRLMEDESERVNANEMANRQIEMESRSSFADRLLPTITRDKIPRAASTSWFGQARKGDVEPYKAKVLSNIMAGEYDDLGMEPLPPSDAAEIFREVSKNRKMAPSPYNEGSGRFEFTPRFTTPQSSGVSQVSPQAGKVTVRNIANGKRYYLPANLAAEALQNGYELAR